jgi:hypothetical protein
MPCQASKPGLRAQRLSCTSCAPVWRPRPAHGSKRGLLLRPHQHTSSTKQAHNLHCHLAYPGSLHGDIFALKIKLFRGVVSLCTSNGRRIQGRLATLVRTPADSRTRRAAAAGQLARCC